MPLRKYKTPEQISQEQREALGMTQPVLPKDKLLLIYARQSTKKQYLHNRESAERQTVDLLNFAIDILAWPADGWIVFVENKYTRDGRLTDKIRSVSARFGINDRPGLREVTQLIEQDKAGVVLVTAVDRLFRDETGINEREFVILCRKHHVLVLTHLGDGYTPDVVYDFSRKQDRVNFLKEAEKAAEYSEHQVKGVMGGAKRRKGMRGEYTGHPVAAGLLLDDERKFFVPNPYWKDQVEHLFKRCIDLDFSLAALRREVVSQAYFPDFPPDVYEEMLNRMGGRILLKKVPGGYTVSSISGLKSMLTNVEYIGHAYSEGRIVKRNAFPAIVREDYFWPVFNRFSEYDIQGNRIKSEEATVRYTREATPKPDALLAGLRANRRPVITSTGGKSVYVLPRVFKGVQEPSVYAIVDRSEVRTAPRTTYIYVNDLDALVERRLLERLDKAKELQAKAKQQPQGPGYQEIAATIDASDRDEKFKETAKQFFHALEAKDEPYKQLYEQFQAMSKEAEASVPMIDELIAEANADIKRIERRIETSQDVMSDEDLRKNYAKLKNLRQGVETLETRKKQAEQVQSDVAKVMGKVDEVREQWADMKLGGRRRFIRLITREIVLDELAPGWLQLSIEWLPIEGLQPVDTAFIWRQTAGKAWTADEEQIVRDLYPTMPKSEVLYELPQRSWMSIKARAMRLGVRRPYQLSDTELPNGISVQDAVIFSEYGLELDEEQQRRVWWRSVASMDGDTSSAPISQLLLPAMHFGRSRYI